MNNNKIPVSECFYSIQGEGVTSGVPSVFLRLAGCNLMCGGQGTQFDKELHNGAEWRCDTLEVWTQGKNTDFENILTQDQYQRLLNGAHLIITGGEPMMQQDKVVAYIKYLRNTLPDLNVEIETNGTIAPISELINLNVQFNCSPKLANSGNDKSTRYKLEVIKELDKLRTQFKFVVSNLNDWKEIYNDFVKHIKRNKVVLMPAGENQQLLERTRKVASNLAIREGVKYSDRLHIVIWNQKTGV